MNIRKPFVYKLGWYEKDPGEFIIDNCILDITTEQLKVIFDDPDFDKTPGCSPVNTEHIAKKLQPYTSHKIDLNKYDYFLEETAIN